MRVGGHMYTRHCKQIKIDASFYLIPCSANVQIVSSIRDIQMFLWIVNQWEWGSED